MCVCRLLERVRRPHVDAKIASVEVCGRLLKDAPLAFSLLWPAEHRR